MALFVRKGGSRHTGQAAPPQRNIHFTGGTITESEAKYKGAGQYMTVDEIKAAVEIEHKIAWEKADVNTDELVHTARSLSACFPVFQCMLSAAWCTYMD